MLAAMGVVLIVLLLPRLGVAQIPGLPGPLIQPPIDPTLPAQGAIGAADDAVVKGFRALLNWMFGDVDKLGKSLVRVLLALPIVTNERAFPKLNDYRMYVLYGAALPLLLLSLIIASLRFWTAGLSLGGSADAYAAVEGFKRVAGAVGMLLLLVPGLEAAIRATNLLTSALVVNPAVGSGLSDSAGPFAVFVGLGSIITGGGLAMIVGIVVLVVAVILLLVKVVITALLMVLYVASPLAITAWPIEELAFLLKSLLGAILGILLFPILWALCFATFTLITPDAMFGSASGDLLKAFLGPLVALAMLIIAFMLPLAVMRMAAQAGIVPGPRQAMRTVMSVRKLGGGRVSSGGARGAGRSTGVSRGSRGPQPRDERGRWAAFQ